MSFQQISSYFIELSRQTFKRNIFSLIHIDFNAELLIVRFILEDKTCLVAIITINKREMSFSDL
jgi:hypothetical protein